jgi:hypothetical protein
MRPSDEGRVTEKGNPTYRHSRRRKIVDRLEQRLRGALDDLAPGRTCEGRGVAMQPIDQRRSDRLRRNPLG